MALATDPKLLVLDEPTTGLDATVEAEVLDLISRAAEATQHGGAVHQPQPRRDREDVPARGRALRGPARRGGHGRRRPADAAPSVHRGPAALHPAEGAPQAGRPARHDPGLPAGDRHPPAGLRLRPPLRARRGHLPRAAAGAVPGRRAAHEPLLLPREGREPAARHGRAGRAADRRSRRRAAAADRGSGEDVPPGRARHLRARGRLGDAAGRRDARPRGRVGIRQDDLRAGAARHHRAHARLRRGRWPRAAAEARGAHVVRRRVDADRLPEPRLGPQPPAPGEPPAAALAEEAARPHRRQGRAARARADRRGAPAATRTRGPADAALRRPEAASGDRARVLG